MSDPVQTPATVLHYWFGGDASSAACATRQNKIWWGHGEATDAFIRDRFGRTLEAAASGQLEDWAATGRGRLALVIVLDQFSRNAHRGTPGMYAQDPAALAHVRTALAAEEDKELAFFERVFLYMPLMHAESREAQAECCRRFEALIETSPPDLREAARSHHEYAVQHQDIVDRFGRFPHRNQILSRNTTPEEAEFLKEPGSSF